MKKIFFLLISAVFVLSSMVVAAESAKVPTKHIVLFYKVSDTILEAQNKKEDKVQGAIEFENMLKKHYGKRFIVDDVRRAAEEVVGFDFYNSQVQDNQVPMGVMIVLTGTDSAVDVYQNAFGAKKAIATPTVKLEVAEAAPNSSRTEFTYFYYGERSYGKGSFSLGSDLYAVSTDPRKNVKAAVEGYIRDINQFNKSINKYAEPQKYALEVARYNGEFEPFYKQRETLEERYNKFVEWAKKQQFGQMYLDVLQYYPTLEGKMAYIEGLKKTGHYQEA